MAALPPPISPTVEAIYAHYEAEAAKEYPRAHLGGSQIGHECSRAIWYDFRWCVPPSYDGDGRILRLFETGHREEERVITNLRAIGATVCDVDEVTGEQYTMIAHGGHFRGSLDGVVRGLPEAPETWHLLEIKTANEKSFRNQIKKGITEAIPKYYSQMQVYMGMAKLKRALYICINKNDDSIYAERVKFDSKIYKSRLAKALRIIDSPEPMMRITENIKIPPCCWCKSKSLCFGETMPAVNCRTCANATPITSRGSSGGMWGCAHCEEMLSLEDQLDGCDNHLYIPPLIHYAIPQDSGDGWVLYQLNDSKQKFLNCGADGFPTMKVPHYSSRELQIIDPKIIGQPIVEKTREMFDAEIGETK